MPYGLFDYGGTINTMGASPPICPGGANPTLTKYKDPALGNRDIGFGKGINGSFKCPPPKMIIPNIICEDGFVTSTPIGSKPIVDPCRGHYKPKCAPTMKTGNCLYKLA